jgi:DNA polymerase-3 subunit delta
MNADKQERLAAFIPKLGEKSCLVLLAGAEDPSKRRASGDGESKKGVRPALTSAVKAGGTVVSFAKLRSKDLAPLVAERVRASGIKMEPVTLQTFSRLIEAHPSLLDREIEKLATYTAGQPSVTLADVENITIKSAEDRVFPLIDAVAGGQPETAVRLLDDTFAASPKPENEVLKVVSLMARHFRLLYQAKYLLTQPGVRSLDSVPEELRSSLMEEQHPLSLSSWQKGKIATQAPQFTMEDLEKCLKRVLDCELAAKGISKEGGSHRLNLEILILRLSQRKSVPL